jgi:hypothetical protein
MMQRKAPMLDHLVVNAMFEIDAAAVCFAALGFTLTPLGYHSLGSVNHLMMLGDHYLELVGLPVGTTTLRREILESRLGIDGLVFKSDDAQATYDRLIGADVDCGAPQSFSRPVEIDGCEQIARFRTTRLTAGELPGVRVYFCEHLTPQWVFGPAVPPHANGAHTLTELVVVSREPAGDARHYARIAGYTDAGVQAEASTGAHTDAGADTDMRQTDSVCIKLEGFDLRFVDAPAYQARYRELVCNPGERDSYFGAFVVAVDDLAAVLERAQALAVADEDCLVQVLPDELDVSDVSDGTRGSSVAVLLRRFNTLIEFTGVVEHVHA